MNYIRPLLLSMAMATTVITAGCAVVRGQETAGAYIDDATITAAIKSSFIRDRTVDASAITVETLRGTVSLSGFARSRSERDQAEHIAINTKGVREVLNNLVVR